MDTPKYQSPLYNLIPALVPLENPKSSHFREKISFSRTLLIFMKKLLIFTENLLIFADFILQIMECTKNQVFSLILSHDH